MPPALAADPRRRLPRVAAAILACGVALPCAAQGAEGGDHLSVAWWLLGFVLLVLLISWLRRGRDAPALTSSARRSQRRRRHDAAREGVFHSTQMDTQQDTVLDPHALEPVRRVGPYLIERDLGRGAMGMVLLGRHEDTGEAVALKTMALGREFHGEALVEARERFFREADTAGRLQHPDIVAVREAGEDGGIAYIAMELLSGQDLSVYAQPSRLLPLRQVLEVGARVAEALAYAHRQGVMHRDIKPANIMVESMSGMVKVTDFGIARVMDSTQTRTGLVLGTPSFMSPEQMAGARTDGRSDLYALGVTLFQLLTGSLPHRADTMAGLIHAIANERAPDLRSLRPELPQALADVVALALEKRPEVRYADGDALAADLRAVLAALPPDGPRVPPQGGASAATEAGHNL